MTAADEIGTYETVIGLEIHVQLQTRTKLFCGCSPRFGDPPNEHTCPVCLGLPGALPYLNLEAVRYAVRTATALGCRIRPASRFARKNYFYPDLPKGYQISQYDEPLAEHGQLAFDHDGERHRVGITRLHMEEDAGKSIHQDLPDGSSRSLIDLNRCGVPLVEIVTEPDLRSPEQAHAFLTTLRNTLLYLGVTDANMEEGSLRCDANISLRPRDQQEGLNPKTELKNLNSFRFLRRALRFEQERQAAMLEAGEPLVHTTRLWDEGASRTVDMRTKEEAHDYRYFPEPDLVTVELDEAAVDEAVAGVPELPVARADRFEADYGLSPGDAAVLVEDRGRADYFEAVVEAGAPAAQASNWVRGQVLRVLNETGGDLEGFGVAPEQLAELLELVDDGTVTENVAKKVFDRMVESGRPAREIVAEEGLEQITDSDRLGPLVDEVLESHPEEVEAYRGGRHQVLGFLMGQVMRATDGQANPQLARGLLQERLGGEAEDG